MIRVDAPTRLHFGLLHVPASDTTARRFGGCGLMLAAPRVVVRVAHAARWSAAGPDAGRSLEFARRSAAGLGFAGALAVRVEACPPGHTGLGVGTALGTAIARGVAALCGQSDPRADELAALSARGDRSAIGARGAGVGGFLVDGGRGPTGRLGPVVARLDFPDWPVVLARPHAPAAWHGPAERAAFDRPRDPAEAERLAERMALLIVLGLLPALAECDYPAFAAALYDYNRLAGEPFAADQGGTYASARVAESVRVARAAGGIAAGQSSWGPTAFAVCADADTAHEVALALAASDPDAAVEVTAADNRGAAVLEGPD